MKLRKLKKKPIKYYEPNSGVLKLSNVMIKHIIGLIPKIRKENKLFANMLMKEISNLTYNLSAAGYAAGKKLDYLIKSKASLSSLAAYVRIAYKNSYINQRNYDAHTFRYEKLNKALNNWTYSELRKLKLKEL